MKTITTYLVMLLLIFSYVEGFAQPSTRPYQTDERRFYLDAGVGGGLLKSSSAYSFKSPIFLPNTGLGWQMYIAPQYLLSDRINLGVKMGGVFRPKFEDLETNSVVQPKFTPFGLLFADYYLGSAERNSRMYIGLGGGVTYIGSQEAYNKDTRKVFYFRRRDRDAFATIVPRFGIAFREFKVQAEYFVTTPYNPDYFSITIMGTLALGRSRYF
jgi:hypothetical protein